MRMILGTLAVALTAWQAAPAHAQLKLPRASPGASVSQTVGLTDVTVAYSRPAVKARPIWGALVPYDKVWRVGANEATTLEVSQDVTVQGQKLPAGKYSVHAIPTATEWTIIFNSVHEQWGSYRYDEKADVLRVKATPAEGAMTELLTFSFTEVSNTGATLELAWEKLRVPLKLGVDTNAVALKSIQENLAKMDDWRLPYRAADYAFSNGLPTADALKWVDKSIQVKETLYNQGLKARMLAKDGKTKDAVAAAEKGIKAGKAAKEEAADIDALAKELAQWKSAKK